MLLNGAFGVEDKQKWLTMMTVTLGTLSILLLLNIVIITIIALTKKTGGGGKQDGEKEEGLKIRVAVGTKLILLVVKNILTVIISLSIILALIVKMKTIILKIITITTTIELL